MAVSVGIGFGVFVLNNRAEFTAQADKKNPSNKSVHNFILERVFHIEINIRTHLEKMVIMGDAITRMLFLLNVANQKTGS